jgi:hypothetical protein
MLKGTVESTGASVQARSSFLAHEIHWNRVFEQMIETGENIEKTFVNFAKFNATRPASYCKAGGLDKCDGERAQLSKGDEPRLRSVRIDLNSNYLNEEEVFL